MDEPLSNLDAQLRVQTRAELKRLQQELGTTTLYVTHDQGEAMTLGSRVALLRGGLVEQIGPPLELYRRPANRFVATFLGSPAINFVPVARATGTLRIAGQGLEHAVPAGDATLEAGVRPEDVEVSSGPRRGVRAGPGARQRAHGQRDDRDLRRRRRPPWSRGGRPTSSRPRGAAVFSGRRRNVCSCSTPRPEGASARRS